MIVGIGCDIVSHQRIGALLTRFGERFAHKILAPSELSLWRSHPSPVNYLAKRFAAKEAFAKAVGTGFRDGLFLKHIAVTNNTAGMPSLVLEDKALQLSKEKNVSQWHLSLSDEKEVSLAFVVLTT